MIRRRTVEALMISAALLVPVSLPGNRAVAATTPQPPGLLAVDPGANGYFEASLSPGGEVSFTVIVSNLGNTTETYRVYPADGTTAPVTGVAYSDAASRPAFAGSWITIAVPKVTLSPGGSQRVTFRVAVPAGAIPGDHVAAIASDSPKASQAIGNPSNGAPSVSLSVTSRVVIAVVIHIPGQTKVALQIGQPSFAIQNGGRQSLLIPLNDTGDLLFKPHITGNVTPCQSSAPAVQIDRQLDTFVPHTAIIYAYQIAFTHLPQGCYALDLHTDYPGGPLGSFHGNLQLGPVAAGTATTVNRGGGGQKGGTKHPAGSVGVIVPGVASALLLGVILLLILFFIRRRRKDDEDPQTGSAAVMPVAVGDDRAMAGQSTRRGSEEK